MPFGQYEDTPLWEVIQKDPEYIKWLLEDADVDFHLSDEALEMCQKELDNRRRKG